MDNNQNRQLQAAGLHLTADQWLRMKLITAFNGDTAKAEKAYRYVKRTPEQSGETEGVPV